MIKLIHTADLHLGATSPYGLVGPRIEEVRREDFHRNFTYIVDKALELDVDFLLISGDVFHYSDPSPRDFVEFCKQLGRLIEARITTVAIAGNHDKPRVMGGKNPLQGLQQSKTPLFYYVHSLVDEPLLLKGRDGAVLGIAPIPYVNYKLIEETQYDYRRLLTEKAYELLEKMEEADFRVSMLHAMVEGAEFKPIFPWFLEEPRLDIRQIKDYDYIALGHIHTPQRISNNTYYAGAIERMSFEEIGEDKSFIYVELKDRECKVETIKLPCRPMEEMHLTLGGGDPNKDILESINRKMLQNETILKLVLEADQTTLNRLRLNEIVDKILNLVKAYRLERMHKPLKSIEIKSEHYHSLGNYIESYIDNLDLNPIIKGRAKKLAKEILEEVGLL